LGGRGQSGPDAGQRPQQPLDVVMRRARADPVTVVAAVAQLEQSARARVVGERLERAHDARVPLLAGSAVCMAGAVIVGSGGRGPAAAGPDGGQAAESSRASPPAAAGGLGLDLGVGALDRTRDTARGTAGDRR
jgi:hypothetical protein